MEIAVYFELMSLIFALIAMFYLAGIARIVDHNLNKIAYSLVLAYFVLAVGKAIRVLNLMGYIETTAYSAVLGIGFIILVTLPIIWLYGELKKRFRELNRRPAIRRKIKHAIHKKTGNILSNINKRILNLKNRIRISKIQKEARQLELKRKKLLSKTKKIK